MSHAPPRPATRLEPRSPALDLVVRVIQRASCDRPADRVLRETLKSERNLSPAIARDVSRAVFAYYRWFGWLDPAQPLTRQVQTASALADRFSVRPSSFPDTELLQRTLPTWLRDEFSFSAPFARAMQTEPRVWLRTRPGQGRALARQVGDCRPFGTGVLADTLAYTGSKDLLRTPEFHAGLFEIQDLHSQAVALVCDPKPGETWWDACSGQGGKLIHLSDLMHNQGLIWGSDRAAWRLACLKRRAARARVFNYRSALWDGSAKLPTRTRFDGILLDAPCSGIGTWHRNPHARWTTTLADITELAQLQSRLLANASVALKPGGRLVYAVCTLAESETAQVAARFQKSFPQFEPLPVRNPLEPGCAPAPHLWLRLERTGGNGMFVAAWARKVGIEPGGGA